MPKCLVCKSNYEPFIDFGDMPIANSFAPREELVKEYKFQMKVGFCKVCKMVQLVNQPIREKMFHENYAFFSSTSLYMKEHFRRLADSISSLQKLDNNSFVVEIGCNDGILLKNFAASQIPCLGIEPSKNVAKVASDSGLNVITEFFDLNLAINIIKNYKKANVILSANVMCHIPYMHSIFEGIELLLSEDGFFVFEDPYLGDVIEKTSFDQIYDEHVFLFSALSVSHLAKMHNLELINVEPQVTHGGSMRYTLSHKGVREVSINVKDLIQKEMLLGLNDEKLYFNYRTEVNRIKKDLIELLIKLKEEGKKVVAYGATSKSTTVTNYFGISTELVECIFDNTPIKQNKFSPGAHIPILPYEDFRKSNPDYVLLFAWNHAEEIMSKEEEYMGSNRHWITYIPKVKIH